MKFLSLILLSFFVYPAAHAQETAAAKPTPVAATAPTAVPALVPFAGTAIASTGKPHSGNTMATFLLFKDESGGEPLWTESQSIAIDAAGQFQVQLGASSPSGLPLEVFADGTARWLEVQVAGQKQQPRVLLTTVPYAAKAADAATLGGLPASAFALAGKGAGLNFEARGTPVSEAAGITSNAASNVTTTGGALNYVPLFTGTTSILKSVIQQSGSSIGIGKSPNTGAILDVNGAMIMRGNMQVSRTGDATASKGFPSYGFAFYANAYNSAKKAVVTPIFQLQDEPTGNNTAAPGATFNLLYSSNGGTLAETGFYLNPGGQIHFAPGQAFPGAVTSVAFQAPGADFTVTGSPVTGAGALNLTWNTPPTPSNTGSAIIKRDSNGGFVAGAITADSLAAGGSVSSNTLTVFGTSYMAGANLAGPVGIGTNSPAALLNLNYNNAANADALLLGNTSSKGLQFRDNGAGVDIESIGTILNINYLTQQPTYINANGGSVVIDDNRSSVQSGVAALVVGTVHGPDGNDSANFEGFVNALSDVFIAGNLKVAGSKDFFIDHPMDPENKYLVHAAIESSEVLNQYSGNITTDELGLATVHLPDWFEVENTDFRYQLTVIGGRFAQAIVLKEMEHNQFIINTNAAGVKVSWQVTARRNDPYMKAHPFVVEQEKPAHERGTYLRPELYGQPEEKRTGGPRSQAAQAPDAPVAAVSH